ncbi:Nuclear export mediator factor Nemf (Serologically defined colon cancer antigen 1 homolog) [Durusdinium trenchii]|uniref:Nuclear export mediator factor Nemf (Serologically defined colon cancer antigen 1 homolog) n=1 Tax=Durusdinium trenchii TaxID=1381693 RepID=A0ABP0QSS9_9DINO
MPKNKFSKLDIRRMAQELSAKYSGMWVNNVYDVNSKTFLLKLQKPGSEKALVVIESGVRFHSTEFIKEKNEMPSGFSMKLRKHVRGKRLISIKQLGDDRVVDFTFGLFEKEETFFHIILELYASGNVVLTDNNFQVLSLIRVFRDDEARFAVGESYLAAIGKSQEDSSIKAVVDSLTVEQLVESLQRSLADAPEGKQKGGAKGGKGGGGSTIKQALSMRSSVVNVLGPDLIEHCIVLAGLSPGQRLTQTVCENADDMGKLADSLRANSAAFLDRLDDMSAQAGALILEKDDNNMAPTQAEAVVQEEQEEEATGIKSEKMTFYERFEPILLEQHKAKNTVLFKSFDEAVDEYFSKIDIQRQEKANRAIRKAAEKKVDVIRNDQASRVNELKAEVIRKHECAEAITYSVEAVEAAIVIVRSAVASGMSWDELDDLIAMEKEKGNPIASLIVSTQLDNNKITLRLPRQPEDDTDEDADEDELDAKRKRQHSPFIKVSVDINLSAFANVSELFQTKKQAVDKAERTEVASARVVREAEKRFEKQMEKHERNRQSVRLQRKVNWFERFNWFVTSEGILVLSGRDAQQNELLVKRYLRKSHGDIYVHADLHGASSCVVRAPKPGVVIPPESLRQAGAMTMCNSSAWTSKVVSSAWWVHADQVSKTAPTGEYLTTGSFMIRGKKNFLPPCRLELSFGFIFKLDETQESFETRKVEWRLLHDEEDDVAAAKAAAAKAKQKRKDQVSEAAEPTAAQVQPEIPLEQASQPPQLKKIKKKYGDQTDEDRRLALLALGHKADDIKKSEQLITALDPNAKVSTDSEDADHVEDDGGGAGNATSQNTKEHPHSKKPAKKTRANRLLDDDTPVDDELNLRSFTANPRPDDVILYALPFCGPPQTTLNFKFRVKLVPGPMKKGKASKAATEVLLRLPSGTPRERELLRQVTDNELVQTMAGHVKIMAPGMAAATRAANKSKKKKSKKQQQSKSGGSSHTRSPDDSVKSESLGRAMAQGRRKAAPQRTQQRSSGEAGLRGRAARGREEGEGIMERRSKRRSRKQQKFRLPKLELPSLQDLELPQLPELPDWDGLSALEELPTKMQEGVARAGKRSLETMGTVGATAFGMTSMIMSFFVVYALHAAMDVVNQLRNISERDKLIEMGKLFRSTSSGMLVGMNPFWSLSVTHEVPLEEMPEAAIFMSNHISFADPFVLSGAQRPIETKWIGKGDLWEMPVVGSALKHAGDLPVDFVKDPDTKRWRTKTGTVERLMEKAGEYLDDDIAITVFPEGTISRATGELLPFKVGFFQLALDKGVPIVPRAGDEPGGHSRRVRRPD